MKFEQAYADVELEWMGKRLKVRALVDIGASRSVMTNTARTNNDLKIPRTLNGN